jgi:phosphoribosylglycinamide formyltransferase-1
MTRIVILASGNGTNAQAILDAVADGCLVARINGVVCNVADAPVLARARAAGVPAVLVEQSVDESRASFDARLATAVAALGADLVVLAGWIRILSRAFLDAVGAPVLNLHPALPGDLPGTHSIVRAWAERGTGRTHSGVMVHLVPDEGIDSGPVLGTVQVSLRPDDELCEFEARMHAAEHALLVSVLADITSGACPGLSVERNGARA